MRKNKLPGRMKAAFLTAALIGTTLMGTMTAQAAPEDKVVNGTGGATVDLPIEQYFNISTAATAERPTLTGTYSVSGDITAADVKLTDSQTGNISLTFPGVGVYEATLKISADAKSPFASAPETFTEEYYLTAYVKNDGKGGFITDITAARTKDDPSTKVSQILFGICADDPPVRKVIQGVTGSTETFDFHMKADPTSSPMPEGASGGEKVVNAGEGGVEFGWMFYDKNDIGEHNYDIWEAAGSTPNWTYDSTRYTKKVNITEGEDGKLAIASVYTDGSNVALFTNTFTESGGGTPSGGGNGPGGGGRRSRPETSNNTTPDAPTTPGEVLGAARDAAEDAGRGVLGAVRNPQVLGAVRTGDFSAMVIWAVMLMLAVSGIAGWFNAYLHRKRA